MPLERMRDLGASEISVSGGEPMSYPKELIRFLRDLRHHNPRSKIWLYTALWRLDTETTNIIMSIIDGVQYSVHPTITPADIARLEHVQRTSIRWPGKSFRLNIESTIDAVLPVRPRAWRRIAIMPMLSPDDCPVPEGETLYIWRGDFILGWGVHAPLKLRGWCTFCGTRAGECEHQ